MALTPSRPESGCVRVIPGSHHNGQLAHFDDHNDALTMLSRGQKLADGIREEDAVDLVLEPGDVSVHHTLTVHSSDTRYRDARRVKVQLAPANLHWCSDEALTRLADCHPDIPVGADHLLTTPIHLIEFSGDTAVQMLDRCDTSRKYGVPLHMHLLETAYQKEYARRRGGCTAVEYIDRFGLLGPQMTLGHGVWLNEPDIERLAESRTCVCHNCSSNFRLRSGVAALNQLEAAGITTAIGID